MVLALSSAANALFGAAGTLPALSEAAVLFSRRVLSSQPRRRMRGAAPRLAPAVGFPSTSHQESPNSRLAKVGAPAVDGRRSANCQWGLCSRSAHQGAQFRCAASKDDEAPFHGAERVWQSSKGTAGEDDVDRASDSPSTSGYLEAYDSELLDSLVDPIDDEPSSVSGFHTPLSRPRASPVRRRVTYNYGRDRYQGFREQLNGRYPSNHEPELKSGPSARGRGQHSLKWTSSADDVADIPQHDEPVPIGAGTKTPPPPLVVFPSPRPLYVDYRQYTWERSKFVPAIGSLYPSKSVTIDVMVTNNTDMCEAWAEEQLRKGTTLYGFETKWWTYLERGAYYSDSYPEQWAELALFQLAAGSKVLLVQPLDMPVEKLGPRFRQILKHKRLKKAGYGVMPKSRAMKMCEVPIHGVHDHFEVLKRTLQMSSKNDLPKKVAQQDFAGLTQSCLGLQLSPEFLLQGHWEAENLGEDQMEFAAKEAFAAWALYGVLSRMTPDLVEEWASWIPQAYTEGWISQQKKARKQMLAEKAVLLPYVREAEERKRKRKSPSRTAKDASVDLLHDIAGDLINDSVFDHDTLLFQTRGDAM